MPPRLLEYCLKKGQGRLWKQDKLGACKQSCGPRRLMVYTCDSMLYIGTITSRRKNYVLHPDISSVQQ